MNVTLRSDSAVDQPIKLTVGGDVQANKGTYLKRPADDQLFEACIAGEFAYVLACRQIGKSSLKNAVAEWLIARGIRVARVDLNRIGQKVKEPEDWYFTLLDELARSLGLEMDLEVWWERKPKRSSLTQRFLRFLDEVVLTEINEPIVIFIDEIDMTLGLPFADDFFAAIRSLYNDRAQNPAYQKLTFVLIGVATPDQLINDPNRTPFNIGRPIPMRDFTQAECAPLRLVIDIRHPGQSDKYFQQIYEWTNGHPYLTQKLCAAVASAPQTDALDLVDRLVSTIFLIGKDRTEDNLRFVQTRVLGDILAREMLQIYRRILKGGPVPDDEKSPAINRLKLYGLVVADTGSLAVRNRIYQDVFDLDWIHAATLDVFVAGGALSPDSPAYIERRADIELFRIALNGAFAYVLAARQMGKSSLMIRTAQRLAENGVSVAIVDLIVLGTNVTVEQWYLGLSTYLKSQLKLSVDLQTWWSERGYLGQVQRFSYFLREIILEETTGPVVIFIDEIDVTLDLPFADDFFALIRACYNARATDPAYDRLTFVLLGVATPADLIKDPGRTPFNIGRRVELSDFSQEDAQILKRGLKVAYPELGDAVFDRIFYWTDGHPYLTQKLCLTIVEAEDGHLTTRRVDEFVEKLFLSREARLESNLSFLHDRISFSPYRRQMLRLYGQIYEGKAVREDDRSRIQGQLKLLALVRSENGLLQVRNEIYRRHFDLNWIKANMPIDWSRRIAVVSILLALLLVAMLVFYIVIYSR